MDKSVPGVTVWHHSTEPRDAKPMILWMYLTLMSDSYILILLLNIDYGYLLEPPH